MMTFNTKKFLDKVNAKKFRGDRYPTKKSITQFFLATAEQYFEVADLAEYEAAIEHKEKNTIILKSEDDTFIYMFNHPLFEIFIFNLS